MKKLLLSLALFFVPSICWSQTAEEVLGKMSKSLAGLEDYQVMVEGMHGKPRVETPGWDVAPFQGVVVCV